MVKTKIVCTLGPASCCEKTIKQMIANSMDCARINLSHGTEIENLPYVEMVKKLRKQMGVPVSLMFDTKGPEVRIGTFKNGGVNLKSGQTFTFYKKHIIGDENGVFCKYSGLTNDVKPGFVIYLNDGLVSVKVQNVESDKIETKVLVGGKLTNNKSMFIPKAKLSIKFLSEQDKKDLKFAIKNDADYVAASFVSCKQDVLDLRNFLDENGGKQIKIISKIENALGVKNIDSILDFSDGVMVARGDLGVQLPVEKMPEIQKTIINKAQSKGKISIIATEMLESMTEKTRPTRAEVSDVANAVYDKASAVMLSGETAVGKNPALVVKTMAKILLSAEQSQHQNGFEFDESSKTITESISHSTFTTAKEVNAKAIAVFTFSGKTAFQIAKFRPNKPIVAITVKEKVFNQLALCYNVVPYVEKKIDNIESMFKVANNLVKKLKIAKKSDMIIITAGLPLGSAGSTNLIKVEKIK